LIFARSTFTTVSCDLYDNTKRRGKKREKDEAEARRERERTEEETLCAQEARG